MELLLYTTDYCQLCEEAETLIYRELSGYQYRLKKVEVSESEQLMADYGMRIPVLGVQVNEPAELDWPFDGDRLRKFLNQTGLINDNL